MRNFTLGLVVFALISTSAHAQNVNIPDPDLQETLSIDIREFNSGIYLVRLRDPDGQILGTRKILKE